MNHWIEDWLSAKCETKNSLQNYLWGTNMLIDFCRERGENYEKIVEDWRKAKYAGAREEQLFLDKWNDILSSFASSIKKKYKPLTQKCILTAPSSFFKKWKIPIDVEMPKRAFVTFHNRDLTKKIIRKILAKANQRNRTMWLLMAESGLRIGTVKELKYWQIKKDFEAGTVPMQIFTPSSELKYHVGDRWSFIGEDGFKALKEYLEPRMPLYDQEYVFQSEKAKLVRGEQFTVATISVQFGRVINALKYERGAPPGKPGHYRLHGLRKYFRNNMRVDPSFREFWMGHSLGVDAHYISRDPEEHRKRYAEGYEHLRILEVANPNEKELEQLRVQNELMNEKIAELKKDSEDFKEIINMLRDPKKMKIFESLFDQK